MRAGIAFTTLLTTAFTFVSKTWAAPDPNFHIYLAFGQSNMQGAGQIENQDKTVDKRFQMLATADCNNRKTGQWYDAVPPLAHCSGGLGPVDYFGRNLVKNLPQEIKVGVAVVAVAGCDIQLFEKDNYRSYSMPDWMQGIVRNYGGNPYGRLVESGKKAMQVGVIKGILLHQGETNSGQQNWPNRVKNIYDNLIKDLGLNAKDVPLLVGEVVSSGVGGVCGGHNSIIAKLPQVMSNAHVISSQGLGQQGDGLHFTSAAYRTFGQRFAETMLKLLGDVKVENGSGSGSGGSDDTPNNTGSVDNVKKFDDGWYYIKNTGSGKYLNVRNGVGANSQNVELGSSKQKWKISNNSDDGTVTFITEFGDYALDVSNGSGENNANIQIYSAYRGDAQKFYIKQTSQSNVYAIVSKASNGEKGLDAEGRKTDDGTNILQWTNEEKPNQTWTFEKIADSNDQTQNPPQNTDTCWSESLGYPCCSSCVGIEYEDNDGQWGIQNGDWCGLSKDCGKSTCQGAQGYSCCKSTCVVYSDEDNLKWGIENDDWCVIDDSKC